MEIVARSDNYRFSRERSASSSPFEEEENPALILVVLSLANRSWKKRLIWLLFGELAKDSSD